MRTLIIIFLVFAFDAESYAQKAEDYFNLGVANAESGDHDKAVADYDKAIELDSNYDQAYYNRAFSKYLLKDYKGAIADYNSVIALNPLSSNAFNNRGNIKRRIR